ncbi:MAG TPA: DUF5696 domain-containing protein [Mobilitalea sp.]|nr:DUF5696 domain-containing protein [Mobilitalea sp.]
MKNKKIKQVITFFLVCSMLSGCSGVSSPNENAEVNTTVSYELDKNAAIIESTDYKAIDNKQDILANMKLQIENDYLALYTGKYYDIAVLDKETGKVFFSNEAIYDYTEDELANVEDERKKVILSQLELEYMDYGKKKTMTSYPDCFLDPEKEQVTFNVEADKLHADYVLGQRTSDMILVSAFTKESYNTYIQKLDEMLSTKEINKIKYGYFVNAYTEVVYDKLDDSQKKEYIAKYPKLEELGSMYIIKPYLADKGKKNLETINTILGIDRSVMDSEAKLTGYSDGILNKLPFFEIPIVYELQGKDLIVTIETENIASEEGYYLTRINLLGSFGASKPTDTGYMFVPEGSGVVIDNNASAHEMDTLDVSFYGADYAKTFKTVDLIDRYASLPVFGIKSNDTAVFGIVEKGDAVAGVKATTNNSYSKYNRIIPYFNYISYDEYYSEGIDYLFGFIKQKTPYTVRYHFLYGGDATYSGMARYYQKYLENTGVITRDKDLDSVKLDLNMIGALTKTVKKLGVPMEAQVAATTFKQAEEIGKELKDSGIANMDVLYQGAINGGLEFKSPANIKFQSELGGKSGYQKLSDAFDKLGINLNLEVDYTKVYKRGNGISSQSDISKSIKKTNAKYYTYFPSNGYIRNKLASYIVNPLKYDKIVDSFLRNYRIDNKNLYLASTGTYLSGNYGDDEYATRNETKNLLVQSLDKLSDYHLKFDSGNEYVLKYADSLTNIETSGGDSRLESYSVPFVGMVLKGYLEYTPYSLNMETDFQESLLKAVESGAGLSFTVMAADSLILTNTEYTNIYSINYDTWKETIIRTYTRLNKELGALSGTRITNHEMLLSNVFQTAYENGTKVIVNYNNEEVTIGSNTIGAQDYLVIN